MKTKFVIKKTKLLFFCALAITVGTPNLDEFDTTGIARGIEVFGLLAPTFLWRMIVFFCVGTTTGLIFIHRALSNSAISAVSGMSLCWLLYLCLTISSIISFSTFFDLALAFYRIFEWVIALLITLMLISPTQRQNMNIFSHYMRIAPLVALAVLGLTWFYNPSLTYYYSTIKETFRLGGIAMHPNATGLLLGLGALYWFVTGRHNIFWAAITTVLMSACMLTWSRSGIGGALIAAFVYMVFHCIAAKKMLHLTIAVSFIFTAVFTLFILIHYDNIFSYILRGEDINYVLSAAGRFDVWTGVFDLFQESPIFGHGFIFGPKLLLHSTFIPPHWRAAHAHNDILNIAISGGIVGALILITIYGITLLHCLRISKTDPLLIATFCGLCVSNFFETGLSTSFGVRGFLLIILFRVVTVKSIQHSVNKHEAPHSPHPLSTTRRRGPKLRLGENPSS